MATSIVPSVLTTRISEEITLNGTNFNTTTEVVTSDIGNFVNNVFFIKTGTQEIINFARTGVSMTDGQYVVDKAKYLRLTNSDDTASMLVVVEFVSSTAAVVSVSAGGSYVLTNFFGPAGATDSVSKITIVATVDMSVPYVIGLAV